jgi:glycosyltransferase involved in cell wall biosynthesis
VAARGLNLVGHLESEVGVGEVARQLVGACDAAEVPVLPVDLPASASRQGHRFPHASSPVAAFGTNLVCVNADQLPAVRDRLGPRFLAGRRMVGMWWWEAPVLPPYLAESFALVDEVWAASGYVATTLREAAAAGGYDVEVHAIPLPVTTPRPAPLPRAELGLPPDAFLFGLVFDHHSVLARKNPLGLVEAYRHAFPDPDGTTALVLKSVNAGAHPDAAGAVRAAAAGRADIVVLDRYLSHAAKDALIGALDCYVSLHRAEGFGITLAEAMALGVPVVATGWSGTAEFCTDATAWIVRHELVPIGPGNDPYPADAVWAEPDLEHAAELLRRVRAEPAERARRADAGRELLARDHAPAAVGAALAGRLAAHPPGPEGSAPALALAGRLRAARERPAPAAEPAPLPPLPGTRIAPMPDPSELGPALEAERSRADRAERLLAEARTRLLDAERRAAATDTLALERDAARVDAVELARKVEVLQADKAELEGRVAQAARVQEDLQASLSWRVTAPLRTAKRLAADRRPR